MLQIEREKPDIDHGESTGRDIPERSGFEHPQSDRGPDYRHPRIRFHQPRCGQQQSRSHPGANLAFHLAVPRPRRRDPRQSGRAEEGDPHGFRRRNLHEIIGVRAHHRQHGQPARGTEEHAYPRRQSPRAQFQNHQRQAAPRQAHVPDRRLAPDQHRGQQHGRAAAAEAQAFPLVKFQPARPQRASVNTRQTQRQRQPLSTRSRCQHARRQQRISLNTELDGRPAQSRFEQNQSVQDPRAPHIRRRRFETDHRGHQHRRHGTHGDIRASQRTIAIEQHRVQQCRRAPVPDRAPEHLGSLPRKLPFAHSQQ